LQRLLFLFVRLKLHVRVGSLLLLLLSGGLVQVTAAASVLTVASAVAKGADGSASAEFLMMVGCLLFSSSSVMGNSSLPKTGFHCFRPTAL
jgi:hypothetical protein